MIPTPWMPGFKQIVHQAVHNLQDSAQFPRHPLPFIQAMHNYKVVHNLQDIHSTIQLGRWRHQAVHNVLALQAVHNYLQCLHAVHNYQDLHQAIHLGR